MRRWLAVRDARQLWLRAHRWAALGIGWLLILSGLTGAMLIVARPLDRWMHPELFRAASAAPAQVQAGLLARAAERIRAEFGPNTAFTLRPPREPGETLWVLVRGGWRGTLYLDPVTGAEQGRRGETGGFVNTIFKLHSALLMDQAGKAVLACAALAYLALLVAGLVLWWPRRWPPSWRIAWGSGALRMLFDLHRAGGAALGLLIAVSVASGAYMAWRPLGQAVSALAGARPVEPPVLEPVPVQAVMPAVTLDEMAARAQARFPGGQVGYVQVPGQANRPVRVRLILPDDPHPNGLTSVWLHPLTGQVLAAHRWTELDPGARAVAVVYPLHTGELGGPLLETLAALGGLALSMLGITGIWLWWRRRGARRARRLA